MSTYARQHRPARRCFQRHARAEAIAPEDVLTDLWLEFHLRPRAFVVGAATCSSLAEAYLLARPGGRWYTSTGQDFGQTGRARRWARLRTSASANNASPIGPRGSLEQLQPPSVGAWPLVVVTS